MSLRCSTLLCFEQNVFIEHLLCVSLCIDTLSSVTLSSSGRYAVSGKINNPKQALRRTTRVEKILKPCEEEFKEREIFIFLLKKNRLVLCGSKLENQDQ